MKLPEHDFTERITQAALNHAKSQSEEDSFPQKVYYVPFLKRFFTGFLMAGFLVSAVIFFAGDSLPGALSMLGLTLVLCVPGLISACTFRITWDSQGFSVRTFSGRTHRFTYEDITGVRATSESIRIEILGKRRITLDRYSCNREAFLEAMKAHRQPLPSLPESVIGMSPGEIALSYKSGVLRQALLVPKAGGYRDRFRKYKVIYRIFAAISMLLGCVSGISLLISAPGYLCLPICVKSSIFNLLPALAALILYIWRPQYFTARPMPHYRFCSLDEKCETYHKKSLLDTTCAGNMICTLSIWACMAYAETAHYWYVCPLAAAVIAWLLSLLGKRYSWEYTHYRVGFGNFVLWAIILGLAVGSILWAILDIPYLPQI